VDDGRTNGQMDRIAVACTALTLRCEKTNMAIATDK